MSQPLKPRTPPANSQDAIKHTCTDDSWCDALSERLQMGTVKGFRSLMYGNFRAPSDTYVYRIGYWKRATTMGGIVLNFCPFCGAYIQSRPGVQPRPEGFPADEVTP